MSQSNQHLFDGNSSDILPTQDLRNASTKSIVISTSATRYLGRYRLISLLGRGGFGEVWRAFDSQLARDVAIKILRRDRITTTDATAEFRREGQQLARLGPIPGVVSVYDVGEANGQIYLVSEFVDGEDLAQRIAKSPLTHQDSAHIVRAVAGALHKIHLKGLIHRDLKPQNILLRRNGSAVIADFGLAVTELEQLSEAERTVGTIAYMSPEQTKGPAYLTDPRSDIYSLGVILYVLLTGRLPFVANTFSDYRELVQNRPPWPLRAIDDTIPLDMERICLKCLEKSPAERFPTALDLENALSAWIQDDSRQTKKSLFSRYPYVFPISIVAALFFGACLMYALSPRSDNENAIRDGVSERPTTSLERAKVISWIPYDDKDNHGYDRENQRYHFDAFGYALFRTDVVNTEAMQLEMQYSTQGWNGMAGVFWNLTTNAEGKEHCFAVMAGRSENDVQFRVNLCRFVIENGNGGKRVVMHRTILKSIPMADLNGSRATIRVDVDARNIVQIWINEVPQLSAAFPLPDSGPQSFRSGAGFGGRSAKSTVFDFQITQKQ